MGSSVNDVRKVDMVNKLVAVCWEVRSAILAEKAEYEALIEECVDKLCGDNFEINSYWKFKLAAERKIEEFERQIDYVDEVEEAAYENLYGDDVEEYYRHIAICRGLLKDVKFGMELCATM